jgi:hypothetical protein
VEDSPVREVKPIWNSSTFLVYTGGLTVLFGGAIGAIAYLTTQYQGKGSIAAWTLLILVILYAIANVLRLGDRPLAAGIFAFSSVIIWGVLVAVVFSWMHFTRGSFSKSANQWSWSRLIFELLILVVASANLRIFRFPFIKAIIAVVSWVFVIDLINAGRNFTLALTLIVGLAYFLAGAAMNRPSAYWLHFVGGLLVSVPILVWCHTSTFDFAFIAFMALLYVAVGHATRRSIWTFYGTIGFFIVTVHFLVGSPSGIAQNAAFGQPPDISAWSFPLGFGLLGFWLVFLGLLGRRRRAMDGSAPNVSKPHVSPPDAPAPA